MNKQTRNNLKIKKGLSAAKCTTLLFCVLLSSTGCSFNKSVVNTETKPAVTIGSSAIDFTLKSNKNDNIRLNELRGNLVLINFWGSFSGTSTRLLDQFEDLYQKHKQDNLIVLSINIDPAASQNIIKKLDPEHRILFDEERQLALQYGVKTVPSTFLVDQNGKIVLALEGFDPRYHDIIENKIETLLKSE